MNIDFKQLIPSNIRTGRWGELMEVIQAVVTDVKTNKIDIIKTQFVIENMTDTQILDFADFLGYSIVSRDGYTATTHYLRKELLSIVPRIINRTTSVGYSYIFNNFNVTGIVYPCFVQEDLTLDPFTTWYTSNEIDTATTLDQEADNILYYVNGEPVYETPATTGLPIATLDPEAGVTPALLDENTILSTITRHILVSFTFNYIESASEFFSTNTADAFCTDLEYNKRTTEVLHVEPKIVIDTNSGTINELSYTNYDETISGTVTSKHQIGNLTSGFVNTIQFGNGEYETVSGVTLTGVQSLVRAYTLAEFQILEQGASQFTGRPKLAQQGNFFDFSEIAFINTESGCIYYAHMPTVSYSSKCYSSVQLDISLV